MLASAPRTALKVLLAALTLCSLLAQSTPGAAQAPRQTGSAPVTIRLIFPDQPEAEIAGINPAAVYAGGIFPGLYFGVEYSWHTDTLTDRAYGFTLDAPYPWPNVEYYPAGGVVRGNYVNACTHTAAAHKFTCTGAFPATDPSQHLTAVVTIYFMGRNDLYTLAQSAGSTVLFSALITYDDATQSNANYPVAVEPIINLTVNAAGPLHNAANVLIEAGGNGPLLQWNQPYPWPDCAVDPIDPRYDEIVFLVMFRKQGAAAWTDVGAANSANCSKQVQLPAALLQCQDNGDPAIYEWLVRTADVRYFGLGPAATKDNVFQFTTASCRPKIEKVQPDYTVVNSYFLANVSVPNKFRVEVDWNGDAYQTPDTAAPYGTVIFNLNATQPIQVEGQSWGAERAFNMGQDFENSLACNNNTLVIKATYLNGAAAYESAETTLQTTVFPNPGWVQWAITNLPGSDTKFDATLNAPVVDYVYDFTYPKEAFSANWEPPSWMPYVGGKKLGILDTQGQFVATGRSSGAGNFNAHGQTGLGAAALDVQGEIFGNGDVQFACGQSLNLTRAELGLRISTPIQKELGLADLVPGVRAAENWILVGRLIRWVNNIAKVEAVLTPNVMVKALFAAQSNALEFTGVEGRAGVGAEATLGVAPIEDLSAKVFGGGEPYIHLQAPANPSYLKELGIDLKFGATLQAWSYEETYEVKYNCKYPGGVCQQPPEEKLLALESNPWHLIPRDYINTSYAMFAPQSRQVAEGQQLGVGPAAVTTETVLLTNLYPRPEPALALTGTTRLLAYVHDDPADPHGRGTEIRVLSYTGADWSLPFTITNDEQPDYAPAVAFDGNSHGVLLWEHSTLAAGLTPTLDITFAQSLEIAACRWNGGACGATISLTSNSLMDHAPRLAAGDDGSVLALWRTNDGNDILGTATHPLTLTYALWNSSSWTTPTAALTGLQDVVNIAFAARSANQAALVYVRDLDGDLGTITDTEVYSSTFNGAAWNTPVRLTDDTLADTAPALAYDAAGNLHQLWLHGGSLVWLKNGGALQTVRPASTGGGFLGFSLARAANGNLALLWQQLNPNGANPTYSVYDAAADDWGAGQALTSDHHVEVSPATAFGADGNLYLAYQKITTTFITQTIQISPTYTVTFTNVPQAGQSDLAFLAHTIGRDLTLDSLTITPTAPAATQPATLTAVLRNSGSLTIADPQVAFYAGVTQIGAQTLGELQAGYTTTVTLPWIAPTSGVYTLKAVADPGAQVTELDETNNEKLVTVEVGAPPNRTLYLPLIMR